MELRNTERSWGAPARWLHWLTAALILVQIPLGVMAVNWRLSPTKLELFLWHKSLGLLLLLLVLARVGLRLAGPTPRLPPDMSGWERGAARASHFLLYALMLALPLSGWVINSAANVPLRVFGLFPLPDITPPNEALADAAERVHAGLVIALVLLLVAHVAAALRHHYGRRNDVLVRMLHGRRAGP